MAITPYLLYEDAGAAIRWLATAFGVRKLRKPMTDGDGVVRHADLAFDGQPVMVGGPADGYKNPKSLGVATVLLYIDVADVPKIFRRAVKAGAKIVESPRETPYGALRCAVEDPEGHQWWFAQPLTQPAPKKPPKKKVPTSKTKTTKKTTKATNKRRAS